MEAEIKAERGAPMAKSSNQKLKVLHLVRIFLEKTDEEHRISIKELIDGLARYGIAAERKSLYDDIEALKLWGMDILYSKEKPAGFYLDRWDFEMPELKLLVDAVQSSKFITEKKSFQLIKKLESLASNHEAKQLQRQVYVTNRIKTMNESIYYNVDKIHEAISANVQIKYQYFEWTVDKQMRARKNGEPYIISPWALTWDDENYYMIGFDEDAELVKHYRVDKMQKIQLLEAERAGKEAFEDFDVARFAKRTFGMFGGQIRQVTLECDNGLVGTILDRFGSDVILQKVDSGHFRISQEVTVSGQFYGWLVGLGSGIKIIDPDDIAEEFQQRLAEIMKGYR
ncbi:MAG: WYL domain-containing protein [Bacillota bacterium]|nr:WYL domain-containing protein [Bacillota bacterium]